VFPDDGLRDLLALLPVGDFQGLKGQNGGKPVKNVDFDPLTGKNKGGNSENRSVVKLGLKSLLHEYRAFPGYKPTV